MYVMQGQGQIEQRCFDLCMVIFKPIRKRHCGKISPFLKFVSQFLLFVMIMEHKIVTFPYQQKNSHHRSEYCRLVGPILSTEHQTIQLRLLSKIILLLIMWPKIKIT